MKEENVILNKSFKFGVGILKLYIHLKKKKVDSGLCSQILDIGTSIGADVEDAIGGSSRKDFISKLQIAYKEAQSDKARYHTKIKITFHEVEASWIV